MATTISKSASASLEMVSLDKFAELATASEKELSKAGKDWIKATVAIRSDSFRYLAATAALGVYALCKHGNLDILNNLYAALSANKATATDADSLARYYVQAVINEGFGNVDGVRDPMDESKWLQRPTPVISFASQAKEGEPNFRLNKAEGDSERAIAKRAIIQTARAKVVEAGLEVLASREWVKRDQIGRGVTFLGASSLRKDMQRLLLKYAPATKDKESNIHPSTILAIGRAAGLDGAELAKVQQSFAPVIAGNSTRIETPAPSVIKSDSPEAEAIRNIEKEGEADSVAA